MTYKGIMASNPKQWPQNKEMNQTNGQERRNAGARGLLGAFWTTIPFMARLASLIRRKCFSSKLFPRSQRSSCKRSETPNCCSVLPDSSKMRPKHPPARQ